jgi:hypothetical protein
MRLWPWINQSKPTPVNQNYEQYNAYSQLLDRNGQWISIADTKAGVILGFLVIVFPVLATPAFIVVKKMVKAISHNSSFWAFLPVVGFIALLVLFFGAAAVTLFRVLMALIPRLTRQGKPGLIFFSDIAGLEFTHWQQRLLALAPQMLALQVLEQIYATAYIANIKHKHVRHAIRALIATVFLGLVLYVLSQIME